MDEQQENMWVQTGAQLGAARAMLDALQSLFMAGQGVVECWEQGDLAGAVHMLEGALDDARPVIAQAIKAGITTGEE